MVRMKALNNDLVVLGTCPILEVPRLGLSHVRPLGTLGILKLLNGSQEVSSIGIKKHILQTGGSLYKCGISL